MLAQPVTRSHLGTFFLAAFAFTWLAQLPALLVHLGLVAADEQAFLPLVGLGALGPMFGALLAARLEGQSLRSVFAGLGRWRVGPQWYPVALFTPGLTLVAGLAVYAAFGAVERWLFLPLEPPRLVAMVVFSFGEEVGWRGYALPRLLERRSPLASSWIVGAAWALWHLPMFLLVDLPPAILPWLFLFFGPGSMFFTWIWRRTGGSLLLCVVAHMGAHLNNSHRVLPGDPVPALAHTAAFCVLAALLYLLDRGAWRRSVSA